MTSSLDSTLSERPVGVFDSGVGGLSVLRAIRQELPDEDLLYVGDSGFAPYGDKPGRLGSSPSPHGDFRATYLGGG